MSEASPQTLTSVLRHHAPWLTVAAVAVFHAVIAAGSVGPAYLFDEVGYLAHGHVLAGHETVWALCGDGYSGGFGVLLAPLWLLTTNPGVVYQLAIGIVVLFSVACMWPAKRLAQLLGASPLQALVAAALITLPASRALMSNYVLPETLLAFLVLCVGWAVAAAAKGAAPRVLWWAAALAGATTVVHWRAMPLFLVTLTFVVAMGWRRGWHAVGAVATGAMIAIGGLMLQAWLNARTFPDSDRIGAVTADFDSIDISRIAVIALGQGWAQVTSWIVLTTLGLGIAIVAWQRRRGPLTRPAWAWIAGVAIAQATAFVVFLARSGDYGLRLDLPIYGRYLDPFVLPLAVIGVVALVRRTHQRLVWTSTAVAVGAAALGATVVSASIDGSPRWLHFTIPGALPYLEGVEPGDDLGAWWWIAAGVVAVVGALTVATRQWPVVAVGALALFFVATSLRVDLGTLEPFEAGTRHHPPWADTLAARDTERVGFVETGGDCFVRNKGTFWLAEYEVVFFDPETDALPSALVVGPADWPEAEANGGVRVALSVWEDWAVWRFAAAQTTTAEEPPT